MEMTKEELEKLKDFKVYVFEGDVYVKAEDYKEKAIENKNLNIKVASLEGEIKGLNSVIDKLREELSAYDREYFDEDKKAKNIFMEEDTLQELRDIREI